ncbi:MAG: heme ABC exporter ATP-binding protein CcmA [Pseudomonadota bacterium]
MPSAPFNAQSPDRASQERQSTSGSDRASPQGGGSGLTVDGGLIVDGLSVHRGDRWVLRNLSFSVAASEALVVRGPNGTGKSTLLRTLAGLTPARAGSATFGGETLDPSHVHFVGHLNALKSAETVTANLTFWARWYETDTGESVDDALDSVGLLSLAELPAAVLSQGQQRRLALARLFLAPRPVWLLDEPTAGLDAASRERLAKAVAHHRAGGGIVVAATHEPLGIESPSVLELGGELGGRGR